MFHQQFNNIATEQLNLVASQQPFDIYVKIVYTTNYVKHSPKETSRV